MVLAVTWVDNSFMKMITTGHQVGSDHTFERIRRRSRLNASNARAARAVIGNSAANLLPIRVVVD